MNFNLCRCDDGYLVSAESVQSPASAQRDHLPRQHLGTILGAQLPPALGALMTYGVAKEGYAFVSCNDRNYAELDAAAMRIRLPHAAGAFWG